MITGWTTEDRLAFDAEVGARQAAALAGAVGTAWSPGGRVRPARGGLAVAGEILVAGDGRREAVARLRRRGWTVGARAGDVVRLVRAAAGLPEIEQTCATLGTAGLVAAPNHLVVAAGGYIKFTGAGAEPTALAAGHIKFARAAAQPTGRGVPARPPHGDGAGVRVALLDTGIDPRAVAADHGWLAGIAVDADNREGPGAGGLLGRATGHGTFCAGIVRQVAPACDITAVRVLNSDGLGTDFSVARAIFALAASDDPPQIVNLSLSVVRDRPSIAIASALAALRAAHPAVVVVAAAGNDGSAAPAWPAADPGVLAVGSPAAYSNHGRWVDAVVPAEGVVSTSVQGVRAGAGGPVEWRQPYRAWTGTSFAAPQVAGLLAVRLSRSGRPALAG
jgi:subtilisin family serine protease